MKSVFVMGLVTLIAFEVSAEIVTREISYKQDTTTLKGFLAYDATGAKTKRPGILVIHEWWGLNDFAKTQAKNLAKLGYIAFAADMYGNGASTTDKSMAMKMAGQVRGTPLLRKRVVAGYQTLLKQENVDSTETAAIGFCFGGTSVLELAYSGAPVKGVVTFHAGIISPSPADMPGIKAKFLVLHGADDPNAPAETIAKFQDAMRTAKTDWQMVYYGNAVHSFTNPAAGNDNSKGSAYNPAAAARAWENMEIFLKELFSRGENSM